MSELLKQILDFNGRKNIFTNILGILNKKYKMKVIENIKVVSGYIMTVAKKLGYVT